MQSIVMSMTAMLKFICNYYDNLIIPLFVSHLHLLALCLSAHAKGINENISLTNYTLAFLTHMYILMTLLLIFLVLSCITMSALSLHTESTALPFMSLLPITNCHTYITVCELAIGCWNMWITLLLSQATIQPPGRNLGTRLHLDVGLKLNIL